MTPEARTTDAKMADRITTSFSDLIDIPHRAILCANSQKIVLRTTISRDPREFLVPLGTGQAVLPERALSSRCRRQRSRAGAPVVRLKGARAPLCAAAREQPRGRARRRAG